MRGVSWGAQKTILVGTLLQGIVAVPADDGTPVPVTRPQVGDEYHYYPHFLPDGDRFFYSTVSGVFVSALAPGQTAPIRVLGDFVNVQYVPGPEGWPWHWTEWGLVYEEGPTGTRHDLKLLPSDSGTPRTLVANGHHAYGAQVSSDGGWIAFVSDESGTDQVYLQRFPESVGEQVPVSTTGGTMPVWRDDGLELFYSSEVGRLMAVSVRVEGATVELGQPRALFDLGTTIWYRGARVWWPCAGGQEFLVLRNAMSSTSQNIRLTLTWTELIEQQDP